MAVENLTHSSANPSTDGRPLRRPHPVRRVAVVVVHGLGEQRPLATMRTFVETYARGRGAPVWSVPDRCDRSFELHTFVVPAQQSAGGLPQMDFYEGYWAAQMRGTRVSHLLRWAQRLVLRWPASLPRRVRWLWWVMISASGTALALITWFLLSWGQDAAWLQTAKVVGAVALPMIAARLTDTLGDAARYLDNAPDNIAARFAVRRNVVDLLEALHEGRRYDRIVVVGHSLGGVIAYDALRLLWARRTRGLDVSGIDDTAAARAADALRAGTASPDGPRAAFDDARADLFARLSSTDGTEPAAWIISDLISVGAPLAYPQLLLAPPGTDVRRLVDERELPVCPPLTADRTAQPSFRYPSRPAGSVDRRIHHFHHAAVFAATRWTNIYAAGDFIGGPVAPVLGAAVRDRRLGRRYGRWTALPFVSHTRYWTDARGFSALRDVLDEPWSRERGHG
jgi:hypothetical protein